MASACQARLLLLLPASLLFLLLLLPSSGDCSWRSSKFIPVRAGDDIKEAIDAMEKTSDHEDWRLDESALGFDKLVGDQEREGRHPADEMLARRHADGSKSYILSGY